LSYTAILECAGKRSATALWIKTPLQRTESPKSKRRRAALAAALQSFG